MKSHVYIKACDYIGLGILQELKSNIVKANEYYKKGIENMNYLSITAKAQKTIVFFSLLKYSANNKEMNLDNRIFKIKTVQAQYPVLVQPKQEV